MSDVMEKPKAIPRQPPTARAPKVLAQRPALERELADLKLQIAETTLAAYEGKPGSRDSLIALDANIRAVTLQLDSNTAAHELALRLDREAKAGWRAGIEAADLKKMVAGITKKGCCGMCSDEHGCVITGLQCGDPITIGTIGPRLTPAFKATAEVLARIADLAVRAGIDLSKLPPMIDVTPVRSCCRQNRRNHAGANRCLRHDQIRRCRKGRDSGAARRFEGRAEGAYREARGRAGHLRKYVQ
jgi:hypothetical protein